jgi:hypothetical protein
LPLDNQWNARKVDFAVNYSKAAADIRKRLADKDLEQAHHLVHNLILKAF